MNINEHDRKEIKGCMKMKEELIQNNDSVCIKRTIPLFSEEEIKNIDENFISIVNEYSKMLVKEKEQKTIQLLLKKQNEEIERLNNIINEVADEILKELNENYYLSYGVALALRQKLISYKEIKGSDTNENS